MLGPLAARAIEGVDQELGTDLAAQIPAEELDVELVLVESENLADIQTMVRWFDAISWLWLLLTLGFLAAAVLLADRRVSASWPKSPVGRGRACRMTRWRTAGNHHQTTQELTNGTPNRCPDLARSGGGVRRGVDHDQVVPPQPFEELGRRTAHVPQPLVIVELLDDPSRLGVEEEH